MNLKTPVCETCAAHMGADYPWRDAADGELCAAPGHREMVTVNGEEFSTYRAREILENLRRDVRAAEERQEDSQRRQRWYSRIRDHVADHPTWHHHMSASGLVSWTGDDRVVELTIRNARTFRGARLVALPDHAVRTYVPARSRVRHQLRGNDQRCFFCRFPVADTPAAKQDRPRCRAWRLAEPSDELCAEAAEDVLPLWSSS